MTDAPWRVASTRLVGALPAAGESWPLLLLALLVVSVPTGGIVLTALAVLLVRRRRGRA